MPPARGLTQALGNMDRRPFIPRDKPRSWVIFTLAGLVGFGCGLCAFGAASQGWLAAKAVLTAAFLTSWGVMVVSGAVLGVGMLTGRYKKVRDKPWRDQVW